MTPQAPKYRAIALYPEVSLSEYDAVRHPPVIARHRQMLEDDLGYEQEITQSRGGVPHTSRMIGIVREAAGKKRLVGAVNYLLDNEGRPGIGWIQASGVAGRDFFKQHKITLGEELIRQVLEREKKDEFFDPNEEDRSKAGQSSLARSAKLLFFDKRPFVTRDGTEVQMPPRPIYGPKQYPRPKPKLALVDELSKKSTVSRLLSGLGLRA